jgi:hypothetical protein
MTTVCPRAKCDYDVLGEELAYNVARGKGARSFLRGSRKLGFRNDLNALNCV